MNEVLLHCHLQFASLYTSSDLWLESLCFQLAGFLQAVLDSALVGILLCLSSSRLKSHIVPLALAVVKSTANPSRSPNLVAHDANFDECCCSLTRIQLIREYAQLHDLVIVEIFDHAKWSEWFFDLLEHFCLALHETVHLFAPTTSSTLHVLWAGTSTSASRCCSSALAAGSSTSSPCLFWPRLSVILTRFVSRSSVFA